jgi:chitin disaccharide deacetylase
MADTYLVIQSDDFGMCHAGNEGVVKAFNEGVLTQASVMVPCPWFGEAAKLAKEHNIPVGVHLTLTSEWDYLRWGPLTGGGGLVGDDGRFPRTIEAVRDNAKRDEIIEEFGAQVELYLSQGLEVGYFDCHMGVVTPEPYVEMCTRYGKPFDYPIGEQAVGFDSIHMLSSRPSDDKVPYLIDRIGQMDGGKHLVVSHCAVDSSELRSMTSDKAENAAWANEYRPSDLAALTSPEVRQAIEEREIRLVSVAELPSVG